MWKSGSKHHTVELKSLTDKRGCVVKKISRLISNENDLLKALLGIKRKNERKKTRPVKKRAKNNTVFLTCFPQFFRFDIF
jgi:hypothetical protein